MSVIITFLQTLNTLSPLAVIALLAVVVFLQTKNHKSSTWQADTIASIKDNDLHELPGIAETLRRIENTQASSFATIIALLTGK